MNIGAPWPTLLEAKVRVLEMQTKLHQWATADESRRFDDLYNLVYDPAFLTVAWSRVRGNKGARSAGVDGETARYIEQQRGTASFLNALRDDLKARTFEPLPVRERMIPKPGTTKRRRLGIPTDPPWVRWISQHFCRSVSASSTTLLARLVLLIEVRNRRRK